MTISTIPYPQLKNHSQFSYPSEYICECCTKGRIYSGFVENIPHGMLPVTTKHWHKDSYVNVYKMTTLQCVPPEYMVIFTTSNEFSVKWIYRETYDDEWQVFDGLFYTEAIDFFMRIVLSPLDTRE